ncbi:hypothetical protein SteCoe_29980 [Stentor coeruleus]|uniref:FYVE-type domain-containing protein n=1 Tax=Stentor coeruleus TaxID=5963 RepID=A0A1R2B4R4_9CILI|nr:hypothetical protein SteCoe_29980 [Stentor coeruleus]
MINPSDRSKVCNLCVSQFNIFTLPRHVCKSCYKFVCQRCSSKQIHPSKKILSRICDSCHVENLKDQINSNYKSDKERITLEINNLIEKCEFEKSQGTYENNLNEKLQKDIDLFKQKQEAKEKSLKQELYTLANEIETIEKEFEDLNNSLEILAFENWEADFKICVISEENKDFQSAQGDFIKQKVQLEIDINELQNKLDKNEAEVRKSEVKKQDVKIYNLREGLKNLRKEKQMHDNQLKKLKENEEEKTQAIENLLNDIKDLSGKKTEPIIDLNDFAEKTTEIVELKRKISYTGRRVEVESSKCVCDVF